MISKIKHFIYLLIPGPLRVPVKFYYEKWRFGHESEMQLLPYLVSKGEVAVDVGANFGIYSFWLYRLGAKVLAFEPHPLCCQFLLPWVLTHTGVTLCCEAISAEDGVGCLETPIDETEVVHYAASSLESRGWESRNEVVVRRLDSYSFPEIAFIDQSCPQYLGKADQEGL